MTDEGVLIGFDDGTNGLFPAALLYAILPQAKSLQAEESRAAEVPVAKLDEE